MKAYLIDAFEPKNNGVKVIKSWEEIAPLLNCDMFDVTKIKFEESGTILNVYVDDNGLCKEPEDIVWGAFRMNWENMQLESFLAGSLLIVSSTLDKDGNEIDLTDEEIKEIEDHILDVKESKNNPSHILAI